MCAEASQTRFLSLWYPIPKALSSTVWELLAMPQKAIGIFAVLTKKGAAVPNKKELPPFRLRGMIWNALR